MELLTAYDWPGNVRELEHCIQHMVACNSGPLLHTMDLPSTVMNARKCYTEDLLSMATAVGATAPRGIRSLPDVEKQAIRDALVYTKGDRGTAAELLGIGRTTLYRKLKEYGIQT